MSKGTRPPGSQPRHNPPRPPSTQPPSRSGDDGRSHEVFVQIASLQMAKARQKRIRSALQDQVETCNNEIERIEQKIRSLYDEAGLEAREEDDDVRANPPSNGDDGFEYEY